MVDRLFRRESGRAVATLIRVLGDFDLAEEAVQEAFVTALERWPRDGIPDNPGAWITRVARNRALDRLRRERVLGDKLAALVAMEVPADEVSDMDPPDPRVPDDRLRLIATCCHPALAPEARVALTLRTLGGLTAAEIARAFLTTESAMARRLVRAKAKIRDARIPYEIPGPEDLPRRLASILATLYLVFNEGYLSTSEDALVRQELSAEAIRLARVLRRTLPDEGEVEGLLALMLLHHARRATRADDAGDLVLLAEQDRGRWDPEAIREGLLLTLSALRRPAPGPYALQAAIAAEHARALTADATDWRHVLLLYDRLATMTASPVVALNRAVAVGEVAGPGPALAAADAIPDLHGYHLWHATRADLLRRLGREGEAAEAYDRAAGLSPNPVVRRFLIRRRDALGVA